MVNLLEIGFFPKWQQVCCSPLRFSSKLVYWLSLEILKLGQIDSLMKEKWCLHPHKFRGISWTAPLCRYTIFCQ
jgi:hypothetical protein